MAKAKIKRTTKLIDLFQTHPQAVKILFQRGLHCLGCALADFETIEEGARAHGLAEKEIDQLIDEINQLIGASKKKDSQEKSNQGAKNQFHQRTAGKERKKND